MVRLEGWTSSRRMGGMKYGLAHCVSMGPPSSPENGRTGRMGRSRENKEAGENRG